MSAFKLKQELRNAIDWHLTFPDFMFRETSFRFAYFFETPWKGRQDIGAELDRLLIRAAPGDAVVSVEHENDGTFDESRVPVTMWTPHEGELFSARRVREYLESNPIWPGLTVALEKSQDWALYENPAEPFGVLVTKHSLADLHPDRDTVFDVKRLLELADAPSIGLHTWVPDRIVASFGKMV
ncbi:MAG TPA: hypothetical protein VGN46_20005 [Luteibacter sp.]|jgi:hypothetical protein|uniref:hypothetical protein n=1 Tax=Luteibacter sp. TaxID=1886636 RepID=UPI002F3F37AC